MNPRAGEPTHVPVLAARVVALLAPALTEPGSVVVDTTLGLGGHAEALLEECPQAALVGFDRDPQALAAAEERLERFGDRVTYVHAVYDRLPDALDDLGHRRVHGVLFDLGVSSLQLDEVERGFAYSRDAPLDMRMDPTTGPTAADVLNTYPAADLARILRAYGEERFARRIADAIVRQRENTPLTTSRQLVDLLRSAIPGADRQVGGHPAKRTFQALRIEVNGEIAALERALPAAVDRLAVGGRVVVLAYHSLEDRLVKQTLGALARPDVPPGVPAVPPGHEAVLRLLTRGAEKATPEEVESNPRATSVRMRAAERILDSRRTASRGGAA
ncbi:16S rRNA (cytosine1402-N4)-methyltransferase [Actinopolymorpha cephalotaxi]|uniref:Ribosomal RNA small subunit methyltransferase H n=1 Tax=Actinopolymorpha cephalotaxi TaxID=504797 RepID=A0A1I2WBZ9_9ACTN|nr:16S rRNA (cytosine(1402)-N(4))-methyltransferase RsmH [Actinopolymorpha cephalotaxi]NYH82678.1 16S rRNA (cytosine1402-N4)-methyltransferase [Actinopolymorpha cephalotaxi]SFG98147.1 16S rRNA (cytosine1402-N4)-methyltransferase [Actinopolymorpha cephalotaxi]